MHPSYYYKLNENNEPVPCSVSEMGRLFGNNTIRKTDVDDGYKTHVSTVFLGIDHSYSNSKPVLFETMIFSQNEAIDDYQKRYTSYQDAVDSHNAIVELLKGKKSEPYIAKSQKRTLFFVNLNLEKFSYRLKFPDLIFKHNELAGNMVKAIIDGKEYDISNLFPNISSSKICLGDVVVKDSKDLADKFFNSYFTAPMKSQIEIYKEWQSNDDCRKYIAAEQIVPF
jgi:hypothetical protein